MHYYLVQFEWIQEADMSYWRLPQSNKIDGSVDLRSIPQMSIAGGTPQGYAFASYNTKVTLPNSIYLGTGTLTAKQKTNAENALGITIDSTTTTDLLWETLTTKSDPTGLTGPKPLMPNSNLQMEVYLKDKIKSEKYDSIKHTKVIEVIQNDYREIREKDLARGSDNYKRVLDAWSDKYKVSYKKFIPKDLPDEGKLKHQTIITESFNTADSSTLGPDLTWVEFEGNIDVVSNQAKITTSSASTASPVTPTHDLSSDDHYTQFTYITDGGSNATTGAIVRLTDTDNYYLGLYRNANQWELYVKVAGSFTQLGGDVSTNGAPTTLKVAVNGSTLSLFRDGVPQDFRTDTTYTGQLRVGIRLGGVANGIIDNFEAGDITGGDLIGHWKMDDGSGQIVTDSSGWDNFGILGATTAIASDDPTWSVSGKIDGALDFDGTDDFVIIDPIAGQITGDFTFTAWIKAANTHTGSKKGTILGHHSNLGDNKGIILFIGNGVAENENELLVYDGTSSAYEITSNYVVGDDTWHFVAYTLSGTTGTLYVEDAISKGTHTANWGYASNDRWSLGQEWDSAVSSDFYDGMMDDVRIYNSALSAGEISTIYNGEVTTNIQIKGRSIQVKGGRLKIQ